MPAPLQLLTHIIPARYFVAILQTEFLAGDVPSVVWPNGLALSVMALLFLGLSRLKSSKRLE
jgi:ABC-2 type transport system permease protein